jgi:hypothetical protein
MYKNRDPTAPSLAEPQRLLWNAITTLLLVTTMASPQKTFSNNQQKPQTSAHLLRLRRKAAEHDLLQESENKSVIPNGRYNRENKEHREKNYAPSTLPNKGPSAEIQRMQHERAVKREAAAPKQLPSALSTKQVDTEKKKLKQQNRDAYQQRIAKRNDKYTIYDPPKANLSPYLNMNFMQSYTPLERLELYNRRHKCPHNPMRCFSNYIMHYHISKTGIKTPSWMEPKCSCISEPMTPHISHRNCGQCNNTQLRICDTTKDKLREPYAAFHCTYCKNMLYIYENSISKFSTHIPFRQNRTPKVQSTIAEPGKIVNWNKLFNQEPIITPDPDNDSLKDKIKDTLEDFPELAKAQLGESVPFNFNDNERIAEQAKSQFGESFISGLKSKALAVVNGIKKLIADLFKQAAHDYVKTILHQVLEFLITIKKRIVENPITYGYLFFRFLFTESNTERLVLLAGFFTPEVFSTIKKLFDKIFDFAWDKIFKPSSKMFYARIVTIGSGLGARTFGLRHTDDYNELDLIEKIKYKLKNCRLLKRPEQTDDIELYDMDTNRNIEEMPNNIPLPFDFETIKVENTKLSEELNPFLKDEPDTVTQQAGKTSSFSWSYVLLAVLGIPATISEIPAAVEYLKNFNVVMSAWKNVNDLIANVLDYLPNCIAKLFTFSKPLNRYSYEARTPGNPINDMVKLYINLATYSTIEANEEFQLAWHKAEQYIVKEYSPSNQVNLLHRSYLNNAKSILSPVMTGTRPIPFVVTLYGKPEKGKSTLWPLLISGITGAQNIQEVLNLSYTRNTACDYFDGYNPDRHKIFVYDDFGQQIDDVGALELISIVSPVSYMPPFAAIDSKSSGSKGTQFNSPIVVINTNFSDFKHCKQIAESNALQRRLGYIVEIDDKLNDLDNKYALFRTYADKEGKAQKESLGKFNVHELQDKFVEFYEEHFKKQENIDEKINSFIKTPTRKIDFLEIHNKAAASKRQAAVSSNLVASQSGETLDYATRVLARIVNDPVLFGMSYLGVTAVISATVRYCSYKSKFVRTLIGSIGVAVAATTAAAALFYMLQSYFGYENTNQQSGETKTNKTSEPKVVFGKSQIGETEATQNANALTKYTQNQVLITSGKNFVNAIMLGGNLMLINKHFIMTIIDKEDSTFAFKSSRSEDANLYVFNINKLKYKHISDQDLTIVELPFGTAPYKDMIRHITDCTSFKQQEGFATRRDPKTQMIEILPTLVYDGLREIDYVDENIRYTNNIRYKLHNKSGDCGSMIFCKTSEGCLKLVGMHCATSLSIPDMSYAILLNKTTLKEHLKYFNPIIAKEPDFPHERVTFQNGLLAPNKNQYICETHSPIHFSGKTTLRPSAIFDKVVEHTTIPAQLKRNTEHDPMTIGLDKLSRTTKDFPADLCNEIAERLWEELSSFINDEDIRRDLTQTEIINGSTELNIEPLDMGTSAGYPFSLNAKLRGPKRVLFEGMPGTYVPNAQLQENLDRWQKLFDENTIPSDPYIATLKDERRKIAKVQQGKTRVFMAGSLPSVYFNKMKFGAFARFFTRIRGQSFSTMGMNKGSYEWHEMISRMKEVSNYGLDGDFENWDGSFKAQVALSTLTIFDKFYQNIDHVRKILLLHSIFPNIRVDWEEHHVIFEALGTMPSGWYLTFLLNSLVNAMYFRIAWYLLVPKPLNDLYYFRKFVVDKYAGDDCILAVDINFLSAYNSITISNLFSNYGLKMTPASKEGTMVPYKKIEELSFLKNTTGLLYSRYVPNMDMDAILDVLNWTRKSRFTTLESATEDNCNSVLRELFFYGKKTFEHYRTLILIEKPQYNLLSYEPLRDIFLEFGSVPDIFGDYTYTGNYGRPPMSVYSFIESYRPHTSDIVSQQSGSINTTMATFQPIAKQTPTPNIETGNTSTLDQPSVTTTNKSGVNLAEQKQTIVIRPHDGNTATSSSRALAHMNEPDWDLIKMLKRENFVDQIAWSLTDAVNSELTINGSNITDIPQALLQNTISSTPFLRFQYWNLCTQGRIKIRMQLTASRFHQGRLIYYFVPSMRKGTSYNETYDTTRATGLEHGFLDPANGTVVDFEIPFVYNKGHIDLVFGDTLGQFHIKVMNNLQVATGGSPTVYVKVYASIEGSEFRIPRQGGVTFLNALRNDAEKLGFDLVEKVKTQSGQTSNIPQIIAGRKNTLITVTYQNLINLIAEKGFYARHRRIIKVLDDMPDELYFRGLEDFYNDPEYLILHSHHVCIEFDHRRWLSLNVFHKLTEDGQIVDLVDSQSGTFEHLGTEIDNLIESTVPSEIIGIADMLLDRPAVTENPMNITRKDAGFMSVSRGVEAIERLTLEPSAQFLTTDQLGTRTSELDLKYLLSKRIFLKTVNWSATANVGDILWQSIVSPTHLLNANSPVMSETVSPTIISWLAFLFTNWRGGIRFHFDPVTSTFHEGRLDVMNHPGQDVPPTDYKTASSQYITSHTIRNETNSFSVVIPYLSDIPWKRVWNGEALSTVEADGVERFVDYALGCVALRVGVPLKAPSNVVQNVDINIFVSAADDFQLHNLTPYAGQYNLTTPGTRALKPSTRIIHHEKAKTQAGQSDMNTADKTDKDSVPIAVARAKTYDLKVPHFGESYSNLREIAKRYTLTHSVNTQLGDHTTIIFDLSPDYFNGIHKHLARAFRMQRGPINCKVELMTAFTNSSGAYNGRASGFITVIPYYPFDTATPGSSIFYLGPANTNSGDPNTVVSTSQHVPLIRVSDTHIAEFQIPFYSIYHSNLMLQRDESVNTYFNNQYLAYQIIMDIRTPAPAEALIRMSMAFADETIVGVFLGAPSLTLSQTQGNHAYPLPPPAT